MSDTDAPITTEPVLTVHGCTPTCPRCGYDLSVATQLWPEDRCLTEGLCTECGLCFSWGEVLNSTLAPWWLIEHHLKGLGAIKALFGSIVIPLAPWHAMRSLPLPLRVRPRLAVLTPLVLLALWYLTGALAYSSEHFFTNQYYQQQLGFYQQLQNSQFYTPPANPKPDLAAASLWLFRDAQLPGYRTSPWSYKRGWPLISPGALIVLLHCIAMPLSFITLRVTLKRVKIQRVHFVRLFSVALIPMIALATLTLAGRAALDALEYTRTVSLQGTWFQPLLEWNFEFSLGNWPFLFLVAYLAWILVYWYSACRWYLRLSSPFFHAAMLFIVASLGTLTLLHFLSQDTRDLLIDAMGALL